MFEQDMRKRFSVVTVGMGLVVVGLLVGSIITTKSLLRNAQLRSVMGEYYHFQQSTRRFFVRFEALPGDLSNATKYWGVSTACSGINPNGTCNGNGDGLVEMSQKADATGETFQFWRQMKLAGLIEGSFSGTAGMHESGEEAIIGFNVPESTLDNAGWSFGYVKRGLAPIDYQMEGDYGHVFAFGADTPGKGVGEPILTPQETWHIDTKMDDGKPGYGKLIARYYADGCAKADNGFSYANNRYASYKLEEEEPQCAFYMRNNF